MPSRAGLLLAMAALGCASELRRFPDRPVAWLEHDDRDVPRAPQRSSAGAARIASGMLDLFIREVDRTLSIEWRRPADDVNALDEVPCSTWFCARNHLETRLTPEAVAAGPPAAAPPLVPFTILAGTEAGAERGFDVIDASGRTYRLKFDPPGHLGLATGAQAVAQRLFWAAGYNTPGAFVVDVFVEDLVIRPGATILHHGYEKRRFEIAELNEILATVARTTDGRIRAVAVPMEVGIDVGAFDFTGRRDDDPNDRIAHQHRRSLRASFVLAAWIGAASMSASDTRDMWVTDNGRHYLRHFFNDLTSTFGAEWVSPKGPWHGEERLFEFSRLLESLVLAGVYRRDWQVDRDHWTAALRDAPAVGWFPAEGWAPERFRTSFPVPAYVRMTDRDAYWGAKVVTAFTDAQIHAAVSAGRYSEADTSRLERALRARRDAIGRQWLTRSTAIEDVVLAPSGALCFDDLAIERGAARVDEVGYTVVAPGQQQSFPAQGKRSCLPLGPLRGDYVVVMVVSRVKDVLARAARVHFSWRSRERRHVIVGIERDE